MILRLLALALCFAVCRQSTSTTDNLASMKQQASLGYERHREAAIQMNDLAGRIRSEADAQALVDGIANMSAPAREGDGLPGFENE